MQKPHRDTIEPYTIIAHDVDSGSPNRMHKRDLPRQLGYKGGFVLGTANYGQMTRGLVTQFGEHWLKRNIVEMKFLKPTFEGDLLRITTDPTSDSCHERAYTVRAHNAEGVEVIRLETWLPSPFPEPDPLSRLSGIEKEGKPERWNWNAIELNKPFRPCFVTPTQEENEFWCRELGEDSPIYREGTSSPLHPTLVMRCFTKATHSQFVSDTVVAIANRLTSHRMLRIGERMEIVTIPVEKFQKRGNYWVVMYAAARVNGVVAVESRQTKIFKIRAAN